MWQHLPTNQMYNLKFIIYNLRTKLLIFFIVILHFTFYILHSEKVSAQTFSLGIYPPLLEVMIMPGKTITQKYEIANGENKITLTPKIVVFTPSGEKGNVQFLDNNKETETTKNWFSFENTPIEFGKPFTLSPNEAKSLLLKISIPANAQEKDYYFTLMFSSEPEPQARGSGIYQVGVIGTHLLITISKDGKPLKQGEVEAFALSNFQFSIFNFQLLDSFTQPQYRIRIKNTGKTYWKPFGKITTSGLLGQKWEQELIPDNILGNSIREIQASTPSANQKFLLGPYQAKVEFTPDQEETIISQTISYFAFPFKGLLGIIIGLTIIRIIASFYTKSRP
jgi:hypothetical protein